MRKKLMTLAVVTALSLCLAACNTAKTDTPVTTTTTTPVSTTTTARVETTTTVPETTTKVAETTTPAPTTEAPATTVEPETTTEAPTTTAEPETTKAESTPTVVGSIPRSGSFGYIGNDTYTYTYTVSTGYEEIEELPAVKSGETVILKNYNIEYAEFKSMINVQGGDFEEFRKQYFEDNGVALNEFIETEATPVFKVYRPIIDNKLCYIWLFNGDGSFGGTEAYMYTPEMYSIMWGNSFFEWNYDYDLLSWGTLPENPKEITAENIESIVLDDYKQYLRNDWSEEDFPTVESLLEYYRTTDSMLENAISETEDFSTATIRAYYDWSADGDWYTAEEIEQARLTGEALITYYKSVGLLSE